MKTIQLFGVGCVKYRTLLSNLHHAVSALNIDVKVEEFEDIELFFEKKIAEVPALIINQHIITQGLVLSAEELKNILPKYLGNIPLPQIK